jgi:hypothetical protein
MKNAKFSRMILVTAGAGILLMVSGAARADQDYRSGCNRRLEADRARIDHDAARFGDHSRTVDRDVAKMDSDRQWCKDHHADWDHTRFDVGIYFRH